MMSRMQLLTLSILIALSQCIRDNIRCHRTRVKGDVKSDKARGFMYNAVSLVQIRRSKE